jgi:hypothetical protein
MNTFDQETFFCAIGSTSLVGTNDLTLWGASAAATVSIELQAGVAIDVIYTIKTLPGSYGYANVQDAYDDITSKLNTSVRSGAFTVLLHNISSHGSHLSDSSSIYSNSIFFDPLYPASSPTSIPNNVDGSSVNTGSAAGTLNDKNVWYAIFAIIALVGACMVVFFAIYAYRKHLSNSGGKLDLLARFKRRDSGDYSAEEGEIIPEHGDLVDHFESDEVLEQQQPKHIIAKNQASRQLVFM